MDILLRNRYFGQKSNFRSKIRIMVQSTTLQNELFCENSNFIHFLSKISEPHIEISVKKWKIFILKNIQ